MDNTATLVRLVISTLNDVEIKGKHNMEKLLGSINALETISAAMDSHIEEKPNKEKSNG